MAAGYAAGLLRGSRKKKMRVTFLSLAPERFNISPLSTPVRDPRILKLSTGNSPFSRVSVRAQTHGQTEADCSYDAVGGSSFTGSPFHIETFLDSFRGRDTRQNDHLIRSFE